MFLSLSMIRHIYKDTQDWHEKQTKYSLGNHVDLSNPITCLFSPISIAPACFCPNSEINSSLKLAHSLHDSVFLIKLKPSEYYIWRLAGVVLDLLRNNEGFESVLAQLRQSPLCALGSCGFVSMWVIIPQDPKLIRAAVLSVFVQALTIIHFFGLCDVRRLGASGWREGQLFCWCQCS